MGGSRVDGSVVGELMLLGEWVSWGGGCAEGQSSLADGQPEKILQVFAADLGEFWMGGSGF